MALAFKTIGLVGKPGDRKIHDTLNQLRQLLSKLGIECLLDETNAREFESDTFTVASRETIGKQSDLLIIVGGDGTLLDAARSMHDYDVPMLGVNLGRLGFLVDISPRDMEKTLEHILQGDYKEERRTMLEAHVTRGDEPVFNAKALNDIVIHKVNVSRMIEFEVYIDGKLVYLQRSDGLIISTPTGSTAYSLSGGGPILHPSLAAITLVPICPHTLSNRPIVIGTEKNIEICPIETRFEGIQVSCDGQITHKISQDERVRIEVCDQRLRLLHPKNYDYYQILRTKLNWASHNY
jgi:NAD+ kinase